MAVVKERVEGITPEVLADFNKMPEVLTAPEVAKILGISKSNAYNIFKEDDFPAIHLGQKRKVVTKESLRNWLTAKSKIE